MTESICNFVPDKSYGDIRTVHFVYETEFHSLKQPFMYPIHYLFLVTSGKARIRCAENCFTVERGCVFFFFPALFYEVEGSDDFRYMYISFTGEGAAAMLSRCGIDIQTPPASGLMHLTDFWFSALLRADAERSLLLSESVLLYTLAFLTKADASPTPRNGETLCKMIADYVDAHYDEIDLSLGKIASVFAYTEKYLSVVFKKYRKIGFHSYLADQRLRHAEALLLAGEMPISEVAAACGYRDALYFSRVFKAAKGVTPSRFKDGAAKKKAGSS